MGRRAKEARLWLRKETTEGDRIRAAEYIIRDGRIFRRTGCGPDDRSEAEKQFQQYLAEKHAAEGLRREGDPAEIPIADVISLYLQDIAPGHARPEETAQRAEKLLDFWAAPEIVHTHLKQMHKPADYDGMLDDVRGDTCRAYIAWRTSQPWRHATKSKKPRMVSTAAARRELEDLKAAINHHRKEGYTRSVVSVVLPAKPSRRESWLTRDEAARILWAMWRYRHPMTGERRRAAAARFFLIALYTGSRAGVVCGARLRKNATTGYIDLKRGMLYRMGTAETETAKRRPPAPLPDRLIPHIRRWVRLGISRDYVVEYHGKPVKRVSTAFESAVTEAGFDPKEITPHVLRHTAATWLLQAGVDKYEAGGFIGATADTIDRTYGHHHPDYLRGAAAAMSGGHRKAQLSGK